MENRFSICLNHGGKFDQRDSNSLYDGYDGSAFKIMRDIDADLFGYMDLVEEVDKLGYKRWDNLYYKIPGVVGEGSIKLVCNDVGVMEMIGYAAKGVKYFDVFVDGCKEEEESVELKCNEKEGSEYLISGEDSSEDEDFLPIEESSSEDGESENGLASEDEEYVEARRNIIKYKKWKGEDDKISHPNNLELAVLEEIQSDYADSDCEQRCIGSDESDDFDSDEGCFVRKRSKITYDPNCDHKKLDIRLGMRFESIHQCKRAVQKVAIINGYDLRYVRTNKGKLQARCVEGCPWRLYASFIKSEGMFAIKTLVGDHTCNRDMHTKQATADWIACEYLNTFRSNPNMTIAQLGEDIMKNFAVEPTRWKLYRGKWKALQMLRGSVVDHYAGLRSYMAELQRVDKEGRFEFLLADDSVFRAMYIGFNSKRKKR